MVTGTDCPRESETRQEFGHFEADTVLSGKRKAPLSSARVA